MKQNPKSENKIMNIELSQTLETTITEDLVLKDLKENQILFTYINGDSY